MYIQLYTYVMLHIYVKYYTRIMFLNLDKEASHEFLICLADILEYIIHRPRIIYRLT